MIYSVFNYHTNKFSYYEPVGDAVILPPSGSMRSPRGVSPESAAVIVPAGAKLVGEGEQAKGLIGTLGGLAGDPGAASFSIPWGSLGLVALGVGVGLSFRKRGRK